MQLRHAQPADELEIPLSRIHEFALSARAQGVLDSLARPFPWPAEPWYKIDFIYAPCTCAPCCQPFPDWSGRGQAMALGDINDPFFAGVVKSFAYASIKIEDFVAYLDLPPSRAFVVNIGAASAFRGYSDPTQRLFEGLAAADLPAPFGGLLIDAQEPTDEQFGGYPVRPNVTILSPSTIEASNAASILQDAAMPQNFALLKVDVDSTDLGLIAGILEGGFTPAVIYMELNTAFPPPFRFAIPKNMSNAEQGDFGVSIWMSGSLYGGVSLSAAADFLAPRGYMLVEVDGWDATWVHKDALAKKPLALPTSLADEFYRGLQSRVHDMSGCYCRLVLTRVVNDELWSLALDLQAPGADRAAILARAKEIVDEATPRHKTTGERMRYDLALDGPANDFYQS